MEMTLVPTGFYELPIFKALSREEVDEIGRLANPVDFSDREVLFEQGAPSTHLDIIWEGGVEIARTDLEGDKHVITTIMAKSVVGEMSLMNGQGRSCTGCAVGKTRSYRIRREDFMGLLDLGSLAAYKVTYNLAQVMSGRLRTVDDQLVALMQQRQEQGAEHSRAAEFSDFRQKLFNEWVF
jgi:CRP-like cAMP-binding protein